MFMFKFLFTNFKNSLFAVLLFPSKHVESFLSLLSRSK